MDSFLKAWTKFADLKKRTRIENVKKKNSMKGRERK